MTKLLRFEPKHQPLLSRQRFVGRLTRNVLAGSGILLGALALGTVGYHQTCFAADGVAPLSWLDSLLNAAMILSGMGPLVPAERMSDVGKLFAAGYALFSGVVFIATIGVVIAPIAHRVLHRFHLDEAEAEQKKPRRESRDGAG